MKKYYSIFLSLLLITVSIFTVSLSESFDNLDIEKLDFDSLLALKNEVDMEYFSREGSKPFTLPPGKYTVGTDIKAGKYFIAKIEPSKHASSWLNVYDDEEEYVSRNESYCYALSLYDDQVEIKLHNGEILRIDDAGLYLKSTMFTKNEFYHYEQPEGSLFPKGIYYIGEGLDLAPGTYTLYATTLEGSSVKIYKSPEKYKSGKELDKYNIAVTSVGNSQTVQFEEGYVLEVEKYYSGSVIVNKSQPVKQAENKDLAQSCIAPSGAESLDIPHISENLTLRGGIKYGMTFEEVVQFEKSNGILLVIIADMSSNISFMEQNIQSILDENREYQAKILKLLKKDTANE